MFRFFRKRPKAAGQGTAAQRPSATPRPLDPDDPPVGTIDDWFVRTTRRLLKRARPGAGPDGSCKSPHEERIAGLEQANAALKAENERLAGEVVALRTLLYGSDRKD